MSDFEYASVVVSIVLALGIADILRYLADTFREPGSRKVYWVHLLWVLVLLQLHVEFWWRMWSFKDVVAVGPTLGLLLLGPAVLFVATRTLLPTSASDADVQSLYYRRKTPFFVLLALSNIWALMFSPLSAGIASPGNVAVVIAATALMMLFVACIFSSNRLLHQGVVSLVVALELLEKFSMT